MHEADMDGFEKKGLWFTGLPTHYARTGVGEDFADSFEFYVLVRRSSGMNSEVHDALVWMWNGGKERYAFIDRITGNLSAPAP